MPRDIEDILAGRISGKRQYLWRAVDQDGEVIDVFLQQRRDGEAAKRFFKQLLKSYQCGGSNHYLEPTR